MKDFFLGERFSFIGTLAFSIASIWGARNDVGMFESLLAFCAAQVVNSVAIWIGKK